MVDALAVAESVESSNMPARQKSAMLRFLEGKISPRARHTLGVAKAHIGAGGTAMLSGAVAGLTGAGLGYAHAELAQGLDMQLGTNSTKHVPLDGVLAVAGLGGFVLMPREDFSSTLCRVGSTAFGVLAFRKTHDWAAARKAAAPAVHGEDPTGVEGIGRMLGIR